MLSWIMALLRKTDYRTNTYAHPDLSSQTRLPWQARLKLMLATRGGLDHADETPTFWVRHRRWLWLVMVLWMVWVVAESAVAWNFFDN